MNHALIANLHAATDEATGLAEMARQIRFNLSTLECHPDNFAQTKSALVSVVRDLAVRYVNLANRIQEIEP